LEGQVPINEPSAWIAINSLSKNVNDLPVFLYPEVGIEKFLPQIP